jgi:hypothetical protein
VSDLSDLPIDEPSRKRLSALVDNLSAGHLVILEAPAGDVGPAAAVAVGEALLSEEARKVDLRVAVCESGKWTMGEIDDWIVAPSRLTPQERAVVIVEAADRMDTGAAEHLLKTLEEPSNGALFIFCVEHIGTLLSTVVGRASEVIHLEPVGAGELVERLVERGVAGDVAQEAVSLCGPFTALAERACGDDELLSALRDALGGKLETAAAQPSQAAAVTAEGLERLAKLQLAGSGKVAQPAVRARSRELARVALSRWKREVSTQVRLTTTRRGHQWAKQAAGALDAAGDQLSVNTSVAVVLAGLFTTCKNRAAS